MVRCYSALIPIKEKHVAESCSGSGNQMKLSPGFLPTLLKYIQYTHGLYRKAFNVFSWGPNCEPEVSEREAYVPWRAQDMRSWSTTDLGDVILGLHSLKSLLNESHLVPVCPQPPILICTRIPKLSISLLLHGALVSSSETIITTVLSPSLRSE